MRPVLAPDAFVRTYVSDEGVGWVLVRRGRGQRVRLDAAARTLTELADGARTLEQLAAEAGARLGRRIGPVEAREWVERLGAVGAVVDAAAGAVEAPPPAPAGLVVARVAPGDAPPRLAALAGVGFDCDGRGGCCRPYDRVVLDAAEVAELAAAFPDGYTPGGLTVESALSRDRGGVEDRFVLAVVDGACVALEADGRCGVHRRLGAARKPAGCRAYPLVEVLCGDELAVGVAVECRCAIDFAAGGAPIDALAAEVWERRVRAGAVEAVADEVPLTATLRVARSAYRAWRSAATERLAASVDVARWALDEAMALGGVPGGAAAGDGIVGVPGGAAAGDAIVGVPGGAAAGDGAWAAWLGGASRAVADYLRDEAADTARVYPERDLSRQLFAWAAAAGERLCADLGRGALPSVVQAGERLAAAGALHTHGLLRSRTLATGLVALGLRLLLARAGGEVPCPPELLPVSVVELLHRAQGLSVVVDDHFS